ncbi:TRAP transporter small permease [Bacteriovorax sp. Seq25_V]|uniref:TRAP transporter small permease n=1 Tax=Bacteriovorax sp. Seq25_V TaxID=1201288 RepID=UPI00038A0FE4|nr:TRAP transporter small permease [Bacteriovorax sp. Seq25_V]EQC47137.1 TRAP transporter, DctQ-like membrane protein [Bacteriovorax sp. Seq25_V]
MIIRKTANLLDSAVKKSLVLIVFGMLGFSVSNVVLRWFGISYAWIEPLVRHMVFATAFLGATLATAASKHIAIEIFHKILETKGSKKNLFLLQKLATALTAIVLFFLANSGYEFFSVEQKYGAESFLGLHTSTLVLIIPIGFSLMFLRAILDLLDFSSKEGEE